MPALPLASCLRPAPCILLSSRLLVRKRTASATVEGRPGRPSCMVLAGFKGHAAAGTFGRLSTFWPGEFHPFATVSTPKDSKGGKRARPPS